MVLKHFVTDQEIIVDEKAFKMKQEYKCQLITLNSLWSTGDIVLFWLNCEKIEQIMLEMAEEKSATFSF